MSTVGAPSFVSKLEVKLRTMPKRWLALSAIGVAAVSVAAGVGLSQHTPAGAAPLPLTLSAVPSVPKSSQATFVVTPAKLSVDPVEAVKMAPPAEAKPTSPEPLALKLDTKLASLEFNKGSTELTAAAKADLDQKIAAYKAAAKVHVRGFSGNVSVAYSVRKGLAFERALRVKSYLVEQGIEPKNVRLFYHSNDHLGAPRAEVSWFVSEDAAEKDVNLKR